MTWGLPPAGSCSPCSSVHGRGGRNHVQWVLLGILARRAALKSSCNHSAYFHLLCLCFREPLSSSNWLLRMGYGSRCRCSSRRRGTPLLRTPEVWWLSKGTLAHQEGPPFFSALCRFLHGEETFESRCHRCCALPASVKSLRRIRRHPEPGFGVGGNVPAIILYDTDDRQLF